MLLHPSPNVIPVMRRRLLLLFVLARLSNNPRSSCLGGKYWAQVPLSRAALIEKNAFSGFFPRKTLIEAHNLPQLAGGWCCSWKWLTG